MTTYVLGSGIAGLVWAFYNKDCIVIGEKTGGQMASHFPCGPRFLHKTPESEKFLKDLNLPIETIRIKTGYQTSKNKVYDVMTDKDYRQRYYMKSRGLNSLEGYDDTAMSSGKNSFEALKVDFNKIIELLVERISHRLKVGRIIEINYPVKTIILESSEMIKFDNLVNTMPLNIFSKIIKGATFPDTNNFKCFPVTYVWLKKTADSEYNYVYIAQDNVPHHRITYDDKGIIAELFGAFNPEHCKKIYKEEYVDSQILYNAQIIPYKEAITLDGVKFCGRYGMWDRHYKTEKVIQEAQEHAKNKLE